MVTYAGGSDWPAGFTFDSCERMGHYDFVLIGFNDRWEKTQTTDCKAPDTGSVGYPFLNTAACQGGVSDPNTEKCLTNVCGATVGEQILKAQKKGQKILLSVGGANSVDVKTMTPQKGIDLARAVWEVYMGGTDPAYAKYRPFGPKVRVCDVCVMCDVGSVGSQCGVNIYSMCLYHMNLHMNWNTDIHIFPYHLLLSYFLLSAPPPPFRPNRSSSTALTSTSRAKTTTAPPPPRAAGAPLTSSGGRTSYYRCEL
jgi:hypothetical protein